MKIVIAGGNGFLGAALRKYFQNLDHQVVVLTRHPKEAFEVYWDGKTLGSWVSCLETADVLINLAGKSVNCRYTPENKADLLSSRIDSTHTLQMAMEQCQNPPGIWVNSSSATIYIHATTQLMDECNGVVGDDFSMNICKQWEATFFEKEMPHVRKVATRTAIVLGNEGGAYPQLKVLTKLGAGGVQGSGEQMMSWIHVDDFCKAIDFIIANPSVKGVINLCAPQPVTNKKFMATMRNRYRMPLGISQPKWLLELGAALIGTETELLLKSRNVFPLKLLKSGFQFQYAGIAKAIESL